MLASMEITWRSVADNVWVTTVEPEAANVTLIAGDQRAMLVDAGGTAEVGAALIASARNLVDVPVETVVITHHHYDHWHGIAGMDGVETIAHENLVDDDTPATLRPTTLISVLKGIQLGNRFVEVAHFGPGHTHADLVVVVAAANVIVVGDLVEDEPQFDETTQFEWWPQTLDGVLTSSKPSTVVVPGHGAVTNRDFVIDCAGRLADMYTTAAMHIQQGVALDGLYEAAQRWAFSEPTIRQALPLLVAELAAKGIVARKQLPIRGI